VIDRRTALCFGLTATLNCGRRKGAGFPGYAFVANEEGHAVAVVDLTSFVVVRHLALPGRPNAIIAHPSRTTVYALTPETGAVHEIVVNPLSIKRRVRVARTAVSMRLAPDGTALWILCREPEHLVRVDLDQFKSDSHIPLPADPVDFDLSPNGQLCAVSFGARGAVSMFHLAGGRAGRLIPVGKSVGPVRFLSDGRYLLVGNTGDRMVSVLEALTGRVVVHLPLAVRPEYFCFKADGGQLFVTGQGMDAVVVIYPYSTEVAGTLLAGRAPGAMAVSTSPDQEYLFVANPQSGDVTILDIELHRVIAVASVGQDPGFITMTPDNQYALVLNRRSGNMAVIRIAAIVPSRARSAPLFTMIPVGSRPVSAAVQPL
jgi:YVTN family beta-propeller protein